MWKRLFNDKIIKVGLPTDKDLITIIDNPNALSNRSTLTNALELTQQISIDFAVTERSIVMDYVHHKLTAVFNAPYSISIPASGDPFDYEALDPSFQPDVLFQVKYQKRLGSDFNAQNILDALEKHNIATNKGNYLLIIFITSETKTEFDAEKMDALLRLRKTNRAIYDKVTVLFYSMPQIKNLETDVVNFKTTLKPYNVFRDYSVSKPVRYKDDIQKSRWGGRYRNNGRVLEAEVKEKKMSSLITYDVHLQVTSSSPSKPLLGEVVFYLHDTFEPIMRRVKVENGMAKLDLVAGEAFTVGAVADEGTTELELDLNDIDAPPGFKYPKQKP